jgi:phosphoglycerate dehydrogenase-like enzyme
VQVVDTLEDVLTRADFVTLHVPLSAATRHLIGARELRLMKPGAYLINASRGPVVDEPALIAALEEGHLAGAGLDVFDPEPPLPSSPLRRLPNVVITPHVGTNTPQARRRMGLGAVEQVLLLARGERPTALLDPAVWPGRAAAWLGR